MTTNIPTFQKCHFSKKSLDSSIPQIFPKRCWNSQSRDKFPKSGNPATTVTWSEPSKILLPRYCDATKANSRTICSRLSQPTFSAKERNKWTAISWLHYTRRVNWLFVQYECHIGKLSMQELTQLIGIKLLIWRFPEILRFNSSFQGCECPFCSHLRTPMVSVVTGVGNLGLFISYKVALWIWESLELNFWFD